MLPAVATAGGTSAAGPAGPLPVTPAPLQASSGSACCGAAVAVPGGGKPLHTGETPQDGSKRIADGRPTLEHAQSELGLMHFSSHAAGCPL